MAFELPYLLCLLLFLQILPFSTIAQAYNNISLGSYLTAKGRNSFWPSPSGDFAFGFLEIDRRGFLLAIWFNKIPERTIVWSANGDNLLKKGSKVELTADGQFILSDIVTRKQKLIADSAANGVAYAAMLDTGNFVLANRDSKNLWETFDHPTDTILPTQTLNQDSRLVARYAAKNYSAGWFQFRLQSDGNLMLYTISLPYDFSNFAYWSTNTGNGFQLIFNQSGSIYLTSRNGSILNTLSNSIVSMQDFYQRATLDYNGVFRHYIYPKSTGSNTTMGRKHMAWSPLSFIPSDICTSITPYAGIGACGLNSLCRNDDDGPVCMCPNGYSFVDPTDVMKGCKQNFISQSCDEASPETDLFYFQEVPNGDWPFSYYENFNQVSADWCRQNCLSDCFCAAVILKEDGCWKKGIPLINGRIDPVVGSKALIKTRKDNSTSARKDGNPTFIAVVPVLLGSSTSLNFLLLIITYLLVMRLTYYRKAEMSMLYPIIQGINLKCFTYMELKVATNGFKEELGRGAFATVFKGVLASEDGKEVVVKRLDTMVRENDFEFKAEVSSIGGTYHKNLVKLLGFCNEGLHRMLVYEFMSNGSLASFLFGESTPSWYQRKEIALGTARGLLYLHEECSRQIIHCDIKPQNILLDDCFTAKIANFGVAKLLKRNKARTTSEFTGTKGYVAPEWFTSLPVTAKVDVYSFGILLLEIICCRKNREAKREDEDQMTLADWAYDCYKQKKLHLFMKNDDDEAMHEIKIIEKYTMISFWCIQEDPSLRPTMKNVTQMLEGTVEVSIPPNPSSLHVQCNNVAH